MPNEDIIYSADLDDSKVLAALERINKNVSQIADQGEKSFQKIEQGASQSGISLDVTSEIAKKLFRRFIDLGVQAIKTFAQITEKAIDLNREAELVKLSLTQIFGGNEQAADAFIKQIGDLAIKLGVSREELTGLAKGILPDIGSIKGTTEFLENIIVLGKDAGQNIDSIRLAAEEALGGNLSSLQRRLNIPPATIESIKEYIKETGLAAAITKGLAERAEESGVSAEVTANSFATLEGKIGGVTENFQRLAGQAPFGALKEQAQDVLDILDEQGPEIAHVAEAFGDLAAKVIEFVGSNITTLLENIDFQNIEQMVDGFRDALESGKLLLNVLFDIGDTNFGGFVSFITEVAKKLETAAMAAAQLAAIVRAEQARSKAELEFFKKDLDKVFGAEQGFFEVDPDAPLGFLLAKVAKGFASTEKAAQATALGQDAYEASVRKSLSAFDEHAKAQEEDTQKTKDRRKAVEDTTEADIAAGEAYIKAQKKTQELAEAQTKAKEAQADIDKKYAKAEEERQRRLSEIIRKESDQRYDDAVKAAQRREDLARKNADSIEDIFRKNDQDITDAATDLSRKEQDIAQKASRQRQDIERDYASERIDIERNLRQELRRIQDQFNQDAEEAERNNDAQAFLRAVRSRDQQVKAATENRDTTVEDAKLNAEKQRQDLAIQLAAEVEDAKIANQQKLEDLQLRLSRELEAQSIKNEREIEAETIKEQRLEEQRTIELQRELDEFARKEEEKQTKLQESLAKQLGVIQEAEQKQIDITAEAEAQKTAIVQEEAARRAAILSTEQQQRSTATQSRTAAGVRAFAAGGRFGAGERIRVGEAGPEEVVFDRPGVVIPNTTMFKPPAIPAGIQQINQRSINNNATFNLAESMFNDPVARRNLENIILEVMARVE